MRYVDDNENIIDLYFCALVAGDGGVVGDDDVVASWCPLTSHTRCPLLRFETEHSSRFVSTQTT